MITLAADCLVFKLANGESIPFSSDPPYANIDDTHVVKGVNLVGLRRAGFAAAQIAPLRQAFRLLFGRRTNLKQALEQVEAEVPLTPEVAHLLEFIRAAKRGVAMGPRQARQDDDF